MLCHVCISNLPSVLAPNDTWSFRHASVRLAKKLTPFSHAANSAVEPMPTHDDLQSGMRKALLQLLRPNSYRSLSACTKYMTYRVVDHSNSKQEFSDNTIHRYISTTSGNGAQLSDGNGALYSKKKLKIISAVCLYAQCRLTKTNLNLFTEHETFYLQASTVWDFFYQTRLCFHLWCNLVKSFFNFFKRAKF